MDSTLTGAVVPSQQAGSESSARTAIVIPNWNGREYLSRCLTALFSQTRQDFQIIVVDNGSTDDSVAWVKRTHPEVGIVALERNLGFGAACNAGIRATAAELIVTLNNDTSPEPEFVAELQGAAEKHPEVGMFAATLWLEGDPPFVDAAGLEIDRLGVAWNLAHGKPVADLPDTPHLVFGPCAGAALYRRQLLEEVGLFDETYFAYLEDAELAWRAQWAGWQCLWVPTAVARHIHSATGRRNLPRKFWLLGRNRLWTLLRHYPRPHLWTRLPLILINELLSGLAGTITLRSPSPLAGRLEALRTWTAVTQSSFPAPRRRSSAEAFAFLSPIPSPRELLSRYSSGTHRLTDPGAQALGQTHREHRS